MSPVWRARISGESPPDAALPDVYAERGRGLAIIRHFTDRLALRSAPGRGTALILTRCVRNGGA